jgi:hypothetical protein
MSTASERIEAANDLGHPQGAYRVELNDAATGKRLELIEADNYITGAYARNVKWWQGAHFHRGGALPVAGNELASANYIGAGMYTDWLSPPRLNASAVVLTDSAVAENSASEWGTGKTIAWGSRWKLTIPASGKRGQINESQSLVSEDVIRLVWDFNETQGNGTFRSLNLADATGAGSLTTPVNGYHYVWNNPVVTDNTKQLYASGMNSTATEAYGLIMDSYNTVAIYKIPLTGGTDQGDYYECASPVKIAVLAGLTPTTGYGSSTSVNTASVIPLGADYLVAWGTYAGSVYVGRYTAAGVEVSKALAVTGTNPSQNITNPSITTNGTEVFIATGSASDTTENHRIHRFNIATQAVDATYSIGSGYASSVGLLGTDLLVGISNTASESTTPVGLHRFNSGGAFVQYYGDPYTASYLDTTVTPWYNTFHSGSLRAERDYGVMSQNNSSYSNPMGISGGNIGGTGTLVERTVGQNNVLCSNGKLYRASNAYSASGVSKVALHVLGGSNIYSRTVLAANQAKSASQTMQITYELTLPSEWRGRCAHVAPPT